MHVEGAYVLSQVLLARYFSLLGCELFKEHPFPFDAVEVKKTFRACVTVPEPSGRAELVVPHHLLL
jgi:hypothetical protein